MSRTKKHKNNHHPKIRLASKIKQSAKQKHKTFKRHGIQTKLI
jgi:hypothetical protein